MGYLGAFELDSFTDMDMEGNATFGQLPDKQLAHRQSPYIDYRGCDVAWSQSITRPQTSN